MLLGKVHGRWEQDKGERSTTLSHSLPGDCELFQAEDQEVFLSFLYS